jgi:hypothetical protein
MARQKAQPETAKEAAPAEETTVPARNRSRLSQEDVPAHSLDQALRVPKAISENYAHKPTRPMNVAGAMKMSPSSGTFRFEYCANPVKQIFKGVQCSPFVPADSFLGQCRFLGCQLYYGFVLWIQIFFAHKNDVRPMWR